MIKKLLSHILGFALGLLVSTIVIDAAAQLPTISFTAPPDGATVAGSVSLGVTTSAQTSCVQYQVDNQVLGVSKTGPFDWLWDSKLATDGAHVLKAIAEDGTGADSLPTTRTIIVANNPLPPPPPPPPPPPLPTLTISAITSGNSGNYTISAKLSQPLSGLQVTIITTGPTGKKWTSNVTSTNGIATTQVKLKGQVLGLYTVQAVTLVNGSTVTNTITFRF